MTLRDAQECFCLKCDGGPKKCHGFYVTRAAAEANWRHCAEMGWSPGLMEDEPWFKAKGALCDDLAFVTKVAEEDWAPEDAAPINTDVNLVVHGGIQQLLDLLSRRTGMNITLDDLLIEKIRVKGGTTRVRVRWREPWRFRKEEGNP